MSAITESRPSSYQNQILLLLKLRTFLALILVFGYFAFAAPNFMTPDNMVIITKHVALNAFLAIGMTFVIITGGIDLSVGSTVGLSAMVSGWLVLYGIDTGTGWTIHFNTLEIALLTCVVGIVIGTINGLLITKAGVAPFIATLGTLYIARGAALLASGGRTFPKPQRQFGLWFGYVWLDWNRHNSGHTVPDLVACNRGTSRFLRLAANTARALHLCSWRQ